MSKAFEIEPVRTGFLNKKIFRTWIKYVAKKMRYYDRIIDVESEPSDVDLQKEWNEFADEHYAEYLKYSWTNGMNPLDIDWLIEYWETGIYEEFDGYKDYTCGWTSRSGIP